MVGHTTGLATASWFGDPLGNQSRPGQNITVNGQFYKGIDGYMIAGPQWSNFMAQIAPAYGTNPFPAPPSNMVSGGYTAPVPRVSTQATAAAPAAPATTQATPAPSDSAPPAAVPGNPPTTPSTGTGG